MEQTNVEKLCSCGQVHETVDDYIKLAEKLGLNLTYEDLVEIQKVLEQRNSQCIDYCEHHEHE